MPNPKAEFVPGMYAYGSVLIERQGVRALPVTAITQIGNQSYCYLVVGGMAVRTAVQTGVSDGSWIEVTGKLVRSSASAEGTWESSAATCRKSRTANLCELTPGSNLRAPAMNPAAPTP